ncbi:MAG: hypothetical protein HYV90_02425 [Candidatus Woesebacteria bacterium]|nr:MAG: hypothetical protein HYV90_02425 [Candidatus Woesebacteria bacterium]
MEYDKSSVKNSEVDARIQEGDIVIFLESQGTVDGKPSAGTTSAQISLIHQLHRDGDKVILADVGDNNLNNFIVPGSSIGYVRTSELVPFRTVADGAFVPGDEEIEKEEPVSIRIGKKDGSAYMVDGICKGYDWHIDGYRVSVKNEEGLEAMLQVGKDNVEIRKDSTIEDFTEFWLEHSKKRPPYPSTYDNSQVMQIVSREPELIKKYLPMIKEAKDVYKILEIIDKNPMVAHKLFDILTEIPELIDVYAKFALRVPYLYQNAEEGREYHSEPTRISTSPDPEFIRNKLNNIKEIEHKLETYLEGREYAIIAEPLDGLAFVSIVPIKGRSGTDGVSILIAPGKGNDFVSVAIRVFSNGTVDSGLKYNDWYDLGYMFKENPAIDEEEFLNALVNNVPMSDEMNLALEKSGRSNGKHGKFERLVLRSEE